MDHHGQACNVFPWTELILVKPTSNTDITPWLNMQSHGMHLSIYLSSILLILCLVQNIVLLFVPAVFVTSLSSLLYSYDTHPLFQTRPIYVTFI